MALPINGTIEVNNNAILVIGGIVSSTVLDTIVNNDGTLMFGASTPTGNATLHNVGNTFTNGAVNDWKMGNTVTIDGGAINTLPGHNLIVAPSLQYPTFTLNNVTLNGTIEVSNVLLIIPNGITGSGVILANGSLIDSSASSVGTKPQLVIGAGTTIRGRGDVMGDLDDVLVVYGTLEATPISPGGGMYTYGHLACDGTLATRNGSALVHSGTPISFANGGYFAVDLGGPLAQAYIDGNLDLRGDDYLDLTMLSGGTAPFRIARNTGTLNDIFDHVTPGYTVDYSRPGGIYVSPIPEPTFTVMAGTAALFIAISRSRGRLRVC